MESRTVPNHDGVFVVDQRLREPDANQVRFCRVVFDKSSFIVKALAIFSYGLYA